jgi:diaminohydroxyphosphoribosylaminopyrimidine deaminase/5-amino-6-(5-phosphoribosylamino)uracil reductase
MAPKLLGSDARPLAHLPLLAMEEAVDATIRDCVQVGGDLRLRLVPRT